MQKVVKNGLVAVVLSGGFGAGWYSCHQELELVFHPKIVELVEKGKNSEITEQLCQEILGKDAIIFTGDVDRLYIRWIPEGTRFNITEYDGSEGIITEESLIFTS